jgi:hypothetical protein
MTRKQSAYQPRERQVATLMMRLSETDRERLNGPAVAAWEEIQEGAVDPDLGRTVLFRLHYVFLAAHNYEEENYLRILASLARDQMRDYIYRVRLGIEHVFSESDRQYIGEALAHAACNDENLTRKAVLGYYEQIANKLLRDPIFASRLS